MVGLKGSESIWVVGSRGCRVQGWWGLGVGR